MVDQCSFVNRFVSLEKRRAIEIYLLGPIDEYRMYFLARESNYKKADKTLSLAFISRPDDGVVGMSASLLLVNAVLS
jgi:hypothetical protein